MADDFGATPLARWELALMAAAAVGLALYLYLAAVILLAPDRDEPPSRPILAEGVAR